MSCKKDTKVVLPWALGSCLHQPGDTWLVPFLLSSDRVPEGKEHDTNTHLIFLPHQLFVDKDTIVNAVGASHDIHLLKIDNREDELVTRTNSWCTHLVDMVSGRYPGLEGSKRLHPFLQL